MIIYCFKSEDFETKRLVYQQKKRESIAAQLAKWQADKDAKGAAAKKPTARRAPVRRTPEQEQIYRANIGKGRIRRHNLDKLKKVIDNKIRKVRGELSREGAKQVMKDLDEGGYSQKRGWREWNKKFAGDDPAKAKEKIMEIQRVVFTKLGILNDPSADIDGKLGPYTLAAMAVVAGGSSVAVPIPGKNTALRDYVAKKQGGKAESEDQEVAEKPKEDENKAEKAKKEKEYAKIKANLAKNEKEIDKKREEVEGLDKELKKRRNFNKTQWGNIRKKLDAQADKEEKELRDVEFELTRLEGVAGKLEEKQDIALFGPESVAKRKLEKVEEEIRTLWKKLNPYKAELPGLETMIEAGLNKAETMLGNKKAQIQQTKDELWKKEQEAIGLKAQIKKLEANA